MRSKASSLMVTWDPPLQKDRQARLKTLPFCNCVIIAREDERSRSMLTVLMKIVVVEVMEFLISVIVPVHSLKNTKRHNYSIILFPSITLICHFPRLWELCALFNYLFCFYFFLLDTTKILVLNVPKVISLAVMIIRICRKQNIMNETGAWYTVLICEENLFHVIFLCQT